MNRFAFPEVATLFVVVIIPYIRNTGGQIVEITNETTTNVTAKTDINFEALSLFGVTAVLAEQFRSNLLKAIEIEEKGGRDQFRQGEFGGVSGGFYQGGNAGTNGAGGVGGGNQEEDGDEEDEEDVGSTTPGPGAFGVLSGIFGIFSGLGTLNPSRIIQSTVNFFPPGQRMQAQMIVDSLIGYVPPDNRTTPTSLALNETVMSIPITIENRTVIEAKTNEKGNAKDAENIVMVNATTADGIGSGNSQSMTMLQVVEKATSPKPIAPEDLIIVHELLTETVSLPAVHEDDEIDLEERHTTTLRPRNSTKSEYKIKDKVATAVVV